MKDYGEITYNFDKEVNALLKEYINKALTARDEEWKTQLQPCIDYCKEYNGLPYCKNCGLDLDNLISSMK